MPRTTFIGQRTRPDGYNGGECTTFIVLEANGTFLEVHSSGWHTTDVVCTNCGRSVTSEDTKIPHNTWVTKEGELQHVACVNNAGRVKIMRSLRVAP